MLLRTRAILALLAATSAVVGLTLAACGGDDTSAPTGSDGGGEAAATDAAKGDAAGDAGTDAAPSGPTGSIAIFSSAFKQNATVNVSFTPNAQNDPLCTVTVSGACRVLECPVVDGGIQQTPPTRAGAGTVAFDGGTMSFAAVPTVDGLYASPQITFTGATAPFAGGETATLTASGGDVPAFSQTLTYPILFLLQQPAIPDGGNEKVLVPRNADFTFTWSRGTANADLVVQGSSTTATMFAGLSCTFPSAAGTGTVPQALLSKLSAATDLRLFSAGKAVTQAGDYTVTSYLAGEVLTPSKGAAVSFSLQ